VQLSLQLPDVQGGPVHLEASAQVRVPQREVELTAASGTYRDLPVRLVAPAHIHFGEELTVSNLQLSAKNAVLALQGRLTPDLDVRVSLTQVDSGLVNAIQPGLLSQGQLAATAQLRGPLTAPQGHVHVEVTGLRLAETSAHTLPLVVAQGDLELRGDRMAEVDAKLSSGSGSSLTLRGHAPLPQGSSSPAPAPDRQLDLALAGNLDLALANARLETQGRHAEGMVAVDAHVIGTLGTPEIAGRLTLEHGDLRDYTQGVHLSNVQALLIGNHGVLEVDHLTARAASGDVNITGTLALLQPHLPVDLHLTARHAQPLASDLLTANLDADLDLKGTLAEQLTLSGTIHVIRADIGIPNSLPQDVAVLDVRRPGVGPPAPAQRPVQVALDVRLDAPRQILVTGRGLDAELGGDLHIRGTKDQPAVSGGFDMIRGTLSLASTPLSFTSGRVSFTGAGLKGRIDPSLDFTAQSSVADTTVILRITGPADAPQFSLTSTPQELPQDEILSRLLFGESASQLSAAQLVTMGSALATVTGVGSGVNPLVKVQKTLGLDRLSVSGGTPGATATQQNTGATVEAGRYVVSNVYVAGRQSTTGVTQLVVDLDITRSLKVRTRLGNGVTNAQGVTPENDPGSSIGVSYQFEY
jgi:translocation and assembly module TamB